MKSSGKGVPVTGARTFAVCAAAFAVLAAAGCTGPVTETAGLTPPSMFQQAEAAYLRSDLAAAKAGFRRFARTTPRDPFTPWAYYWEGKIDLKQERFQEALYAFRRALDAGAEPLLRGALLMALGDVAFNRRHYGEAADYYRRVDTEGLTGTVRQDELYFKTGLAFLRKGRKREAERYFRMLERFPGSPYVEEARRRAGKDAALTPLVRYVLLGAYSRWENADRLKKRAVKAGFGAVIEQLKAPGGYRYEVRVPVIGSGGKAEETAAALQAAGFDARIIP